MQENYVYSFCALNNWLVDDDDYVDDDDDDDGDTDDYCYY